jgi:mRNA-degrading endonuclease YafQ of YafQ-DinJ toxin-antitoxin module
MIGLTRFSDFLALAEGADLNHPYYKASQAFKDDLNDLDPYIRGVVEAKIAEFKKLKTLNPQDLIKSPSWKDHALRGELGRYYEAHLIHGQLSLIYYHGGRYIIFVKLVLHSTLLSPARLKDMPGVLDRALAPVKSQVEQKLKAWDEMQAKPSFKK